jgi:eukaryotic-like serine/threonine-protein kinase
VLGTAAYLAPEQARGEEAGPRADLSSPGVVAYQLLTGRLPYEATSLSELALRQQREPPSPIDELNREVPPELADAVATALSLDQEARPATAMLFAEAVADGARAVEPLPTVAPARNLGATAPTRVLTGRGAPTAETRVGPPPAPAPGRNTARNAARNTAATGTTRPLESRRPAYSAQAPSRNAAYDAPAKRARGSRTVRRLLIFLLVVILFVAAVAVALTISASTSSTVVHFRRVVAHDTNSAINQLQSIINQYTK